MHNQHSNFKIQNKLKNKVDQKKRFENPYDFTKEQKKHYTIEHHHYESLPKPFNCFLGTAKNALPNARKVSQCQVEFVIIGHFGQFDLSYVGLHRSKFLPKVV